MSPVLRFDKIRTVLADHCQYISKVVTDQSVARPLGSEAKEYGDEQTAPLALRVDQVRPRLL